MFKKSGKVCRRACMICRMEGIALLLRFVGEGEERERWLLHRT